MKVIVLSNLIYHDQVGHTEGTGVCSCSAYQGGLHASNSDIDVGGVIWSDRERVSANVKTKGIMFPESNLDNVGEELMAASRGNGAALY